MKDPQRDAAATGGHVAHRPRLRRKLVFGLALMLAIVLILTAGSWYGLASYRRSNAVYKYHHNQQGRLAGLDESFSKLRELYFYTSRSGRTGDEPVQMFYHPDVELDADQLKAKLLQELERLRWLLDRYEAELQRASRVYPSLAAEAVTRQTALLGSLRGTIHFLIGDTQGRRTSLSGGAGSRRMLAVNERLEAVQRIDTRLTELRGVIAMAVTRHFETDTNSIRTSMAIVSCFSALALVMLGVVVRLGHKHVFQPIRKLHQGVQELAEATRRSEGPFDSQAHRIDIDTDDEIEDLSDAFNDLSAALQRSLSKLQHEVEDTSRQLIRSERLASVGHLAAGVSHEINNPLASIAFSAEALEGRLDEAFEPDNPHLDAFRSYLKMIQDEAFRGKGITDKLLDFSRAGSTGRQPVDMNQIARDVIDMVAKLGMTKTRSLKFEADTLAMVKANPQEMRQVLLNLVRNALECVPEEGGVVRIDLTVLHDPGATVQLTVRDNGCGMTPEVSENLFEPFFTRKSTGTGNGLGLSISHLIVSEHGGTLAAASAGKGQGSAFTIRLPALAARAAA